MQVEDTVTRRRAPSREREEFARLLADDNTMTVVEEREPLPGSPRSDWSQVGLLPMPGLLDHYRLVEPIAESPIIAAYLAEHELLGRRVVVKLLTPAVRHQREVVRAFLAEAQGLWQIGHPGFPAVLDYGRDAAGTPYVVTEYAAGEPLASRLERHPLATATLLDLADQLASALAAAHVRGVAVGELAAEHVILVPDAARPSGERIMLAELGGFACDVPAATAGDLHAFGKLLLDAALDPRRPAGATPPALEDLLLRMIAARADAPALDEVQRVLRVIALEHRDEASAAAPAGSSEFEPEFEPAGEPASAEIVMAGSARAPSLCDRLHDRVAAGPGGIALFCAGLAAVTTGLALLLGQLL